MANYNHEILVNYLRDVYSMELLVRKIKDDVFSLRNKISEENAAISDFGRTPFPVEKEPSEPVDISPRLIFYFFILFISLVLFKIPFIGTLLGVIGVMFSLLMLAGSVLEALDDASKCDDQKDYLKRRFRDDVMKYEQALIYVNICKADLPAQYESYNAAVSHLQEAKEKLQSVYSVNIIPNKYRSVYVAYYLYDYISSSHETDIDRVLQTMLLDQIIAKLDKIIAQQEEIILNQRMQLAKQDALLAQSKKQHEEQMKAISNLEENQQMQNDYLAMTEANTRITNYFVTADYINKYI